MLRGERLLRALPVVAAILALTVVTAPVLAVRPKPGLEESWHAALHLAARRGMAFGDGMVLTYGPLGFLNEPVTYFTSTAILSSVYLLSMQAALCTALVTILRRSFGVVAAVALAYVAVSVSRSLLPPEIVVGIYLVVGVALLRGDYRPRTEQVLVVAGGLLAGAQFLLKFNTGVTVVLVGAVTAWFVGQRTWRSEALFLASAAGTVLGGWLVTGNNPIDLVAYVANSIEVASGYSEVMGIEVTGRGINQLRAALVVAVLAALGWVASRDWPIGRRVGLAIIGAIWAYVSLKHGFVRHDGHDVQFFGVAMFAAAALVRKGPGWALPALSGTAVMVAMAGLLLARDVPLSNVLDPRPALREARTGALDLALPGRRERAMETARAAMRSGYGLTPATLAHLEGRTVHFYPFEASMAWAYLDMKWRPLPVYQAYTAYTSKLDRLNARFLAGPSAPERILIEDGAIDGRNPDWESPSTILALMCHYRLVATQPRWAVLARIENRCGAPVSLGVAHTGTGQTVAVPQAAERPDMVIMARVHGLDASPLYALRSALLKIPVVNITLDGNRPYRAVPGTASNGLVLRAPRDRVGAAEPLAVVPASTLRIDHGREWGLGSRLRVEFVGVPIGP
jgi:hypothetical protein